MTLTSYPKVYAIGHRNIQGLFESPVYVQEKIDGSQISFGVVDGELQVRSHNAAIDLDAPDKMFAGAVETIKSLRDALVPDWVYRGEVLSKPKHNTLAYDRVPEGNIILFDITTGLEAYVEGPELMRTQSPGLEMVPFYAADIMVRTMDELVGYLDRPSVLGGSIEGIVVKNYRRFSEDGHAMFGKLVSERFKEVHQGDWKERNPSRADVIEQLKGELCTEARWQKAVQHATEDGVLVGGPKDIGPLIGRIMKDVDDEEGAYIRERLFAFFWKDISKGTIAGFPEWYKLRLAQQAFDAGADWREHLGAGT